MADWRPILKRRDNGFPRIMGVLNVTPDSFHAGSRVEGIENAVKKATGMFEEGAEWIDIGGESTRPGAVEVSHEEEARRVIPVIEAVRDALPEVGISIDTRRESIARMALDAGADMVNDVSSLGDEGMTDLIIETGCPICIMHMKGLPQDMQDDPSYGDVVKEVRDRLFYSSRKLTEAGVDPSKIIVDPGIGFGKLLEHNISLLSSGRSVVPTEDMGLMWGVSRKSMFKQMLGRDLSEERLAGTLGVAAMARVKGVDVIRVHDVKEHSDLFSVMDGIGWNHGK
ncbi:MAG: dihydropteroate synthase [Euryarchaeota archaeon]|nr:dihydropteroate synthase [Euryarchaeota archaeon]